MESLVHAMLSNAVAATVMAGFVAARPRLAAAPH